MNPPAGTRGETDDGAAGGTWHRVDLLVLPLVFLADVLVFSRLLRLEGVSAAERIAIVVYSGAGTALLLLRWRAPITVFAGVVAFSLPPLLVTDYYVPFLVPLVALSAVAQLRPVRMSVGCLAVTVVPVALLVGNAVRAATPEGRVTSAVGSTIFYLAGFTLAWGFGFWVGRHQRRLRAVRAGYLLAVQEQRDRADQAVSAERLRIARELHDIVAHSVTIMVLHAAGARRVLRTDPDRAADSLATIEDAGQQAMAELRRLLALLRDPDRGARRTDSPVPGLAHIEQVVAAMRGSGVTVTVHVTGEPQRLDASVDLAGYRLVQEALTNVTKHRGPGARVTVSVEWGPQVVTVAVEDDGGGAGEAVLDSPGAAGSLKLPGGHGLAGLRERIAIAGGDFSAGLTGTGGFRVAARLPSSGTARQPPGGSADRPSPPAEDMLTGADG